MDAALLLICSPPGAGRMAATGLTAVERSVGDSGRGVRRPGVLVRSVLSWGQTIDPTVAAIPVLRSTVGDWGDLGSSHIPEVVAHGDDAA